MKITNIQAGTKPIVIHAPGFTSAKVQTLGILYHYSINPLWRSIQTWYNRSKPKMIEPEDMRDLTIFTWNNDREEKGILEECLDSMGVPYLVLGKGIKEWKHIFKVRLTYEALGDIKTKYVMGLDAYDVILLESPREVIKRFEGFSCEMLFNANSKFYPACHQFELAGEHFITRDWENFESSISDSYWRYLNGGVWIGKTSFCRKFFADCLSRKTQELVDTGKLPAQKEKGMGYQNVTDSEQLLLHWVFQDYFPQVQLDYNCEIFLNLGGVRSGRHVRLYRNFYEILLEWLSIAFIADVFILGSFSILNRLNSLLAKLKGKSELYRRLVAFIKSKKWRLK